MDLTFPLNWILIFYGSLNWANNWQQQQSSLLKQEISLRDAYKQQLIDLTQLADIRRVKKSVKQIVF